MTKYEISSEDISFAERSRSKVLSPSDLENLKAKKVLWISINDKVYDVGSWLQKHPGGDLIIKHFLFRDATEQFTRFHPPEVAEKILPYLQIGILEKPLSLQTPLIKAFREFDAQLHKEGFFDCDYNFYYLETLKGFLRLFLVLCL